MANRQNQHSAFEDQWREAFEEAEITPSASLWNNIDRELTAQESGRYRKGFIFYRWVAAASVVCLLCMSYFLWQNMHATQERSTLTDRKPEEAEMKFRKDEESAVTSEASNPAASGMDRQPARSEQDENSETEPASGSEEAALPPLLASGPDSGSRNPDAPASETAMPPLATGGQAQLSDASAASTPDVASAIAMEQLLPLGPEALKTAHIQLAEAGETLYRVPEVPSDKKRGEEKINFYAGLNLGSNYFDPNFSQAGGNEFATADVAELKNIMTLTDSRYMSTAGELPSSSGLDATPQLSFSYGVDVGMMLSRRLSLESGLDYGRMNTTTRTSWVAEDYELGSRTPVLAANAAMAERVEYSPEQEEINSTFDFISLPIRLGYNFGFERLKFNVSSGVAANFFLGNVLRDDSGRLGTVSLEADEAGTYQNVYYSAVLSGALQYKIDEKYTVSLSPNYNFSITDLTNEGNSFSSQPNLFALDLGLRYLFR
ncbi:MAG: hypothetical protein ACLFT3_10930 [Cyclobacteriaceae bacterium]